MYRHPCHLPTALSLPSPRSQLLTVFNVYDQTFLFFRPSTFSIEYLQLTENGQERHYLQWPDGLTMPDSDILSIVAVSPGLYVVWKVENVSDLGPPRTESISLLHLKKEANEHETIGRLQLKQRRAYLPTQIVTFDPPELSQAIEEQIWRVANTEYRYSPSNSAIEVYAVYTSSKNNGLFDAFITQTLHRIDTQGLHIDTHPSQLCRIPKKSNASFCFPPALSDKSRMLMFQASIRLHHVFPLQETNKLIIEAYSFKSKCGDILSKRTFQTGHIFESEVDESVQAIWHNPEQVGFNKEFVFDLLAPNRQMKNSPDNQGGQLEPIVAITLRLDNQSYSIVELLESSSGQIMLKKQTKFKLGYLQTLVKAVRINQYLFIFTEGITTKRLYLTLHCSAANQTFTIIFKQKLGVSILDTAVFYSQDKDCYTVLCERQDSVSVTRLFEKKILYMKMLMEVGSVDGNLGRECMELL